MSPAVSLMALSPDPRKRARQLQNLRRGGRNGGGRPQVHGAYAVVARDRLEAKAVEVYDALSADAPLRNADGTLPAADAVLVRLLAECLCRLDTIAAHLRDHGILTADGEVRPVVEVEGRLRREAADHAEALGMSPRARAKIGMDLIRAEVAAQGVDADHAARERAAARFAGVSDDVEVVDGEGEER